MKIPDQQYGLRYWFAEVTAGCLVLLFFYTALAKLLDHDRFVGAIKHNPVISGYASLLGWAIPLIELILVALLFVPRTRSLGLLCGSILLSMFTTYIAIMLLTFPTLPCTCGGIIQEMSWRQHLWFNLFFTICSAVAAITYPFKIPLNKFLHAKQEQPNT